MFSAALYVKSWHQKDQKSLRRIFNYNEDEEQAEIKRRNKMEERKRLKFSQKILGIVILII